MLINSSCKLWYHAINNNNWDISSYDKLYDINNNFDSMILKEMIHKNHLLNGMFFVMKDNIEPIWENDDNKNGGYLSYKISNDIVIDIWNKLLFKTINNELVLDESKYNGFSYTPKKKFGIFKIWFNDIIDKENIMKDIDPNFNINNALFKKYT